MPRPLRIIHQNIPHLKAGDPFWKCTALLVIFLAKKTMQRIFVMTWAKSRTEAKMTRFVFAKERSHTKIQLRFKIMLIENEMVNEGVAMAGLRYTLPCPLEMNTVATIVTSMIPSHV